MPKLEETEVEARGEARQGWAFGIQEISLDDL